MKSFRRLAIAAALAVVASAGVAAAADLLHPDGSLLEASAPPGILGPITEAGRTGWNCAPEHAATARAASAAGLPRT
ncbi:MAG TPA: hypothetical protein VGN14_17345 [Candidatus Elarobacter sp.]